MGGGGRGVISWVGVRYVRPLPSPGFGCTVVLGFGVAFPGAIRCNGESISKRDIVRVIRRDFIIFIFINYFLKIDLTYDQFEFNMVKKNQLLLIIDTK